jgi:hypothetical protein
MAVPFRLRLRGYAFFFRRASARATEMGQFRRETELCTKFFYRNIPVACLFAERTKPSPFRGSLE